MANTMDKLAKELKSQMNASDARKPKPYDAQAEVLRVEDGVAWVHIPGGVEETPVRLTINAKKGDMVNIRVANGTAWITGNSTNPPTDDSTANYAVNISNEVKKDVTILNTVVAEEIEATNARFGNVEADTAKIHNLTADQINATVGYIDDLTADHITANDISAASGYIKDLTTDNITASDISADHATVGNLNTNYAQINAANVTDLSAQNAWVNKIMVQTGLLAHEGTVFTLDAIQVNAANITAGTIDVNRLIVTVDGEKYLVEIDPTTHQPSYEKLDGNIVEPRTITADKIVAHDITVQEITTENLVGTNGWINLNQGKFFYGDGANFASATNAISWNGSKLQIKADEFLLSTGQTIQDSIESVENWFYSVPPTTSNPPANSWTTTNLKEQHLRDIYFDTTSGKSYRWSKDNNVYSWVEIEDVELAALAKDLHDNYPPRSEFTVAPDQIQAVVTNEANARKAIYGTCGTAAGTTAKVVTCANFARYTGAVVTVKFTNANTATVPTLNVNSTGAATIKSYTGAALAEAEYKWAAGATLTFVFDGTYWRLQDSGSTAQIKVNADNINLKVAKNDVINQINVSTEGAQIYASKVDVAGAAVFNNYSTTAQMNTAIGDAVDGIEVGGRNLILDTAAQRVSPASASGSAYVSPNPTLSAYGQSILTNTDDYWTYSFDYAVTGNSATQSYVYVQIKGNMVSGSSLTVSGNKSGHYSKSFKLNSTQASSTSTNCGIRLRDATDGAVLTVNKIKLEKGNKETDWTPAPEDVQAEIDAKKSVHTLMSSSGGSTYANILTWTAEGRANSSWGIDTTATPIDKIKVGDTVRVAYKVTNMNNAYVYVIGTFERSSGSTVYLTMHGLDTTIIDGGNILTNSIGANQIKTHSISADKISIGDFTNYITATENDESSLVPNSGATISDGWIVKPSAQNNLWISPVLNQWAVSGEKYRITGVVKAPSAGRFHVALYGRDASGSAVSSSPTSSITLAANTETIINEIVTISNATAACPKMNICAYFYSGTSGSTTMAGYLKQMRCERMTDNALIVNGAITADKIDTNAVTADKLDATTINASNKLTVGSMTSAAQNLILNSKVSDAMNGYTIIWDKNYGASSAGGEALITKYDPLTNQVTLNTAGWVMWNGTKRTVPSTEYNPNSMVPYNIPVYLVLRLTSSTATTGTVYPVWYASSKWNYLQLGANAATTDNAVADWTWVEATDIVLGSCVEPASETIFTDCQIYDPPWTCKQVTSNTVTAQSAQTTANTANNRAVAYRGTCSTAAGTAAKVVTCSNFSLVTGAVITVYFSTANTVVASGITLNVNNTGAKNIQYSSSGTTSSVARLMWDAGATMTFVYDGTQYRLEDNVRTRSAHVGQTGNTANVTGKPWYKFASVVAYATNTDYYATFRVESYPSSDRTGVLKVRIRTDGSSYITPSSCAIYWDSLSNSMATHLTDFVIAYKASTANSTVELWCKVAEAWGSYNFTLLSESTRVQTDTANWTLYYQHTDGGSAAVTSGYTTIASTTKTAYITHIDNNGIRIHPSSTENNSVVINASGMEVFKGGTAEANSVAFYGDTARIGKSGASHVDIASDAISMSDGVKDVFLVEQRTMYVRTERNYKGRQFTNSTDRHADSWNTGATPSTWDSITVTYRLNNTSKSKKITSISNGVIANDEIYVHFNYSNGTITLTYGRGSSAASSAVLKLDTAVLYYVTDEQLSQFMTGTYPDTTLSGALRVGGGTSNSNKKNLMLLEWGGNVKFRGDISAFCSASSSGGLSLTKTEENLEICVQSDSKGTVTVDSYRVGRMVVLRIHMQLAGTTAAGQRINTINLSGKHLPKPLGNSASGASYYGTHSIGLFLNYNSSLARYEIAIHNASSTSFTPVSGYDLYGTLTYICGMDSSGNIEYVDD